MQGKKRENYLDHDLRKKMARFARENLKSNLKDNEAICNSDFSKELEIKQPEMTKDEAYGSSHHTIQVIPVVWEMTMFLPGPVEKLHVDCGHLWFDPPKDDGGGRIHHYEVHLCQYGSEDWRQFNNISVQHLSDRPIIPDDFLMKLTGQFSLRVAATNKAGRGTYSEVLTVLSHNQSQPQVKVIYTEIPTLNEVTEEDRTHFLFNEEHIFISDHGDAPKDARTIRKCVQRSLEDIRARRCREINTTYHRTDTGGENWGIAGLSQYSFSMVDYKTLAVWCPTAAQHSGQLSDASGGTFKKWINTEAAGGNLRGINTASQLFEYCEGLVMFGETIQSKYLAATSVFKKYYHLTRESVLDLRIQLRRIGKLKGK